MKARNSVILFVMGSLLVPPFSGDFLPAPTAKRSHNQNPSFELVARKRKNGGLLRNGKIRSASCSCTWHLLQSQFTELFSFLKVFVGCVKGWKVVSKWNPSNGGDFDYLEEWVGSFILEAILSRTSPVFYGDLRSHERVPLPFSTFDFVSGIGKMLAIPAALILLQKGIKKENRTQSKFRCFGNPDFQFIQEHNIPWDSLRRLFFMQVMHFSFLKEVVPKSISHCVVYCTFETRTGPGTS
ncbi:uncharacterized protein LOC111283556 [Durio zibethinus]|uniref:Uncharacterized protein LOC111283556 n=1 Tax=Durio zibethinus TaxID=66656 RepID=A0A6P5XJ10_DURZI|nr:uncharacterized protein LOC111283556 [Durio zibethinus]